MALYSATPGAAPAAADLNQIINLLGGTTPQLIASMSVANRIRAQLTGATATSGLVGVTVNGPPASGTFVLGDLALDTGFACLWICTTAGSPGSWTRVGGGSSASGLFNFGTTQQALATRSGRAGFDVLQTAQVDASFINSMPGISAISYGFAVPAAGVYIVHGEMTMSGPTSGTDLGIMILKNGNIYQFGTQALSAGQPTHAVTGLVSCAANDLVQLGAYSEGAYSLTSANSSVFFSIAFMAN